jgi:uncharacterized membrane protein YkoI
MVEGNGLGVYTVKILEDNGRRDQVLHLKFVIDSATGRVLNKDGKP